jgi:hypothetical protein
MSFSAVAPSSRARVPASEFQRVALRTGFGFIIMGLVGFFVKLILCARTLAPPHAHTDARGHSIPINNIIIGGV